MTFENPELLVDERVGLGGVGDPLARGQIDLDEFERGAGGRRHRTATVAAVGVGPCRLVRGAHESLVAVFGAGHKFGECHAQCGR